MINVIGLGYIGLPTALMMASHGVEVVGTDYNKELVATLNAGKTTFKEDGLDEPVDAEFLRNIRLRTHILFPCLRRTTNSVKRLTHAM